MSIILGISGKKQSGKTTLSEFLEVFVAKQGIEYKNFSFADPLKLKICVEILGLLPEQVNGTDEQKNSLTKYKWDNLPINIRTEHSNEWVEFLEGAESRTYGNHITIIDMSEGEGDFSEEVFPKTMTNEVYSYYGKIKKPRSGFMTAREVMQVVGTDIFRNMFDPNVWVGAAFNTILKENVDISVLTDVRFETEVNSILDHGGYVIRLERNTYNDTHASEIELDTYDFESLVKKNRAIVVGKDATIKSMNQAAKKFLTKII